MADTFKAKGVAVGNATPAQLFNGIPKGRWVIWVRNTGANEMHVGGSDVTAANGYETASATDFAKGVPCLNPENIYAIATAAETTTVDVFAIRQD